MNDAHTWLGRHWRAVRATVWGSAALILVTAAVLSPPVAARLLSSDGQLAGVTVRRLLVVQVLLAVVAGGLVFVARRFRQHTPANERLVIGASFAVAGLLGTVLLCEAGLWAVSGIRPLRADRHFFFLYDEVLGWRHRPGAVAHFKGTIVRINSDGLRDDELPAERAPGEVRVMFLGDSQVFGDGVSADDTFVQQLERQEASLQAINAAVIGYGTDQQLLYFQEHGARFDLDAVIVGLNAYDLTDNISTRVRSGYVKPRFSLVGGQLVLDNVPIPRGTIVDRVQRQLRARSHLYTLADSLFRRRAGDGADEDSPARALASEVFPTGHLFDQALAVTGAVLSELSTRVRAAGARMAVALLPYQMDYAGDPAYSARADRLAAMLLARGREHGFSVFDLRAPLRGSDDLYLDAVHFNPEGHRRVASALKGLIADAGLLSHRHAN